MQVADDGVAGPPREIGREREAQCGVQIDEIESAEPPEAIAIADTADEPGYETDTQVVENSLEFLEEGVDRRAATTREWARRRSNSASSGPGFSTRTSKSRSLFARIHRKRWSNTIGAPVRLAWCDTEEPTRSVFTHGSHADPASRTRLIRDRARHGRAELPARESSR